MWQEEEIKYLVDPCAIFCGAGVFIRGCHVCVSLRDRPSRRNELRAGRLVWHRVGVCVCVYTTQFGHTGMSVGYIKGRQEGLYPLRA